MTITHEWSVSNQNGSSIDYYYTNDGHTSITRWWELNSEGEVVDFGTLIINESDENNTVKVQTNNVVQYFKKVEASIEEYAYFTTQFGCLLCESVGDAFQPLCVDLNDSRTLKPLGPPTKLKYMNTYVLEKTEELDIFDLLGYNSQDRYMCGL